MLTHHSPAMRVEVGGAVGVVDGRAVRAGDHHLLGLQRLVLDDRVQDVLQVLPHHGLARISGSGALVSDIAASSV